MAKQRQGPRKRLSGPFVPVMHELIKSPLFEMLDDADLRIYLLIRSKENGDPEHDSRLVLTNEEASRHMASASFSQAKLHLWAFRLLKVTHWGRRDKQPSTFQNSNKWRSLIRMPIKLRRIRTLLERHRRVMRFCPSSKSKNANKRSRNERLQKKRTLTNKIKEQIRGIPL